MNAAVEILQLGHRVAWAVLRTLVGLVGLALGAVTGRRRPGPTPEPAARLVEPDDAGFRLAESVMQQMHDRRRGWPEPPPVSEPLRPIGHDALRHDHG